MHREHVTQVLVQNSNYLFSRSMVPSASLAPVPGRRASSVQARMSSLSAAGTDSPRAAADQRPQHAKLARRDPRLGGRPPAQQAGQLLISGAVAAPLRARQRIERGRQPRAGKAGISPAALREVAQPQLPVLDDGSMPIICDASAVTGEQDAAVIPHVPCRRCTMSACGVMSG
jgi:hypothetical protein